MQVGNTANQKIRDQGLDIAKGVAIIIVVIGHTLQNSFENFDELFGFRVIYSFHMPLFILLTGAVASFWFNPKTILLPSSNFLAVLCIRIQHSAMRLLLPFIAWALISNWVRQTGLNPIEIMVSAFRRPDGALWFLLCIFYCVFLFSALQGLLFLAHRAIQKFIHSSKLKQQVNEWLMDGRIQIVFILIAWLLIRPFIPPGAGLWVLKNYFSYYVLGVGLYKYSADFFRVKWRLVPYLCFFPLVLFWNRGAVDNIAIANAGSLPITIFAYCFAAIVAISGILMCLDLIGMIYQSNLQILKKALAFLGKISLGIYALHYFFLWTIPPVLMPIGISVIITIILLQFRITRLLFLGEK